MAATGHSTNPDWCGYKLCDDCIEEYDARAPQTGDCPAGWAEDGRRFDGSE